MTQPPAAQIWHPETGFSKANITFQRKRFQNFDEIQENMTGKYKVFPEGIQPCNKKNKDIYWRRYKIKETLYMGTMTPQSPSKQALWDLTQFSQSPSASLLYIPEYSQQFEISTSVPFLSSSSFSFFGHDLIDGKNIKIYSARWLFILVSHYC